MQQLVLVLNCGSSSVKAAVLNFKTAEVITSCLAEKMNLEDACITFKFEGKKETVSLSKKPNHTGAVESLMLHLQDLGLVDQIKTVGHRVVHGGEYFKESVLITEEVIKGIENCVSLAPLHNPAHLLGIRAAKEIFNNIPHIAVFDTAFHQTMKAENFLYAIPYQYYKELSLRKYGMHGTSYRYVNKEASHLLDKKEDELAMVIAHLGNGASVCAVLNGQSVDTSMGLTPLEGLVMGTRSGDVDPSIFSFLNQNKGLDIKEITRILNNESGVLGVSELSNDFRVLEAAIDEGNQQAKIAFNLFTLRLAKYIAAMIVSLGRLDVLVFTGGIGENSMYVRGAVLKRLEYLGFKIDEKLNEKCNFGKAGVISQGDGPIAMVVPTNEEIMIARDSAQIVGLI